MKSSFYFFLLLFVFFLFSCQDSKDEFANALYGDWQFLNSRGDYNEAFFSDSTYLSYNIKNGLFPIAHYFVRGDTLFSDVEKGGKGQSPIASFASIEEDRIIIINAFSQDTLYRIKTTNDLLSSLNMSRDKQRYKEAFMSRYKAFLIERGIIEESESIEE